MLKNYKIYFLFSVLFILIILFSINLFAQEFKRVQREAFPYSITFAFSITSLSSASYVTYSINPYIYAVISLTNRFDIFFQLPFIFSYNKSYNVDYITDEITKEENYLISLESIIAGFQYTFYTSTINDIYFYISYPLGIYPIFYIRDSIKTDKVEPTIRASIGYRATIIADPLLFSLTPSITGYFNIPELIESKDKWTQQYVISCKINLTVVLNSIISTSSSPYKKEC